jgi:hypothetical protein
MQECTGMAHEGWSNRRDKLLWNKWIQNCRREKFRAVLTLILYWFMAIVDSSAFTNIILDIASTLYILHRNMLYFAGVSESMCF